MPKQKLDKSLEHKPFKYRVEKAIKGKIKLEPKCMITPEDKRQEEIKRVAVTKRGHLLPCCWLDNPNILDHPTMKKLLKVSKISEHNSVEDILNSKVWLDFAKNLIESEDNMDKILWPCIHHCRKREDKDKYRIDTYFDDTGNIIDRIVN